MRAFLASMSLILSLPLAGVAFAHGFQVGDISIGHPYAHATPPSARNGAAYLSLKNTGPSGDVLLGASGDIADRIEIHITTIDADNVAKMRPAPDGVTIPAGSEIVLAKDGYHIMLTGLRKPLVEGDRVPLTLTFRKAGSVRVELAIEAGAQAADPHAGH